MKIKSVQLKNFKRFTDLTIEGIPKNSKLVLLIGVNGSGKSSVFDAFKFATMSDLTIAVGKREDKFYYSKTEIEDVFIKIQFDDNQAISSNDRTTSSKYQHRFIGRSSIRILPKILHQINTVNIDADEDSPTSFIENDTRFQNDLLAYMQAINQQMQEFFFNKKNGDDGSTIFQEFIQPLNISLKNIFSANNEDDNKRKIDVLSIIGFENITSNEPAKLIFKKGNSKINYDLLSHGEKQVIIILLNFIVRRKQYEDAIIYIDEMDCHLNTALQETLLQEITEKWIPDSSQLWTASHALGFIDYARKAENAVILDFDSLDFDVPQIISPQSKEVLDVYDLAIPKSILSQLFKDKKIVFCENKDDEYYNLLGIADTIFVGVKDSRDVFLHVKNDATKFSLRDRDFIADDEIRLIQKKYPNHRILTYYNFENYLFHPKNVAELHLKDFNEADYRAEILKHKKERIIFILPKLNSSRQTYQELKTEFNDKDKDSQYVDSIVEDFNSDDFERFYKFFNMKEEHKRLSIIKYNLSTKRLVSTKWFKSQIEKILQ